MAASATATPAATGAATPAASASDQAQTVDQKLVKRGYRARQINGQLRYCKSETLTGTHFSNTVCLTAEQIRSIDQNTQGELDTMNRAGKTTCLGSNGCN